MCRLRCSLLAFCAGLLVVSPSAARAQTFFELGGGWNYLAHAPDGNGYTHGFNIRASVGRQLAPTFRLRIDAFAVQFSDSAQFYPPCPFPGCTGPYYNVGSVGVAGVTANGLLNVDPRGLFYLVCGAGVYDAYVGSGSDAGLRLGISGGAGIAVPVGRGYRVFIEASYHTFSNTTQPSWMVPITVGLRF